MKLPVCFHHELVILDHSRRFSKLTGASFSRLVCSQRCSYTKKVFSRIWEFNPDHYLGYQVCYPFCHIIFTVVSSSFFVCLPILNWYIDPRLPHSKSVYLLLSHAGPSMSLLYNITLKLFSPCVVSSGTVVSASRTQFAMTVHIRNPRQTAWI